MACGFYLRGGCDSGCNKSAPLRAWSRNLDRKRRSTIHDFRVCATCDGKYIHRGQRTVGSVEAWLRRIGPRKSISSGLVDGPLEPPVVRLVMANREVEARALRAERPAGSGKMICNSLQSSSGRCLAPLVDVLQRHFEMPLPRETRSNRSSSSENAQGAKSSRSENPSNTSRPGFDTPGIEKFSAPFP